MRLFLLLIVGIFMLTPFIGCNDELAVGDEWPSENGSFIGAGMPQDVPASPMQYVTVPQQQSYCRPGDACYQPQQQRQSGQVQRQQYRSYRTTPLRNFGSRVRGFFGRIFSRRGGC